jgi:hypothetical protein
MLFVLSMLFSTADAFPMDAAPEEVDWRQGNYPKLDTSRCMDFGEQAWLMGRVVTTEDELIDAMEAAQGPTRIGIGNDISLTDTLFLRSDIWLYSSGGRHQISSHEKYSDWQTIRIRNVDFDGEIPNFKPENIRITGLSFLNVAIETSSSSEANTWRPEGLSFINNHFVSTGPDNRAVRPATSHVKFARAGSSVMSEGIEVCANAFVGDWDPAETASSLSMMQMWRSTGIRVDGNYFLGRMRTAINVNGSKNENTFAADPTTTCTAANVGGTCVIDWATDQHSADIEIIKNVIERDPTPAPGGKNGQVYEDHGIYVWGTERISILSNSIHGWSATPHGGCVKLASTDDVRIERNTCGSGILLFTHIYGNGTSAPEPGDDGGACLLADALPHYSAPPMLKNVSVSNNTVCTRLGSGQGDNCGVGYMRYRISTDMPWPVGLQGEENILIAGNELNGGRLILWSTGTKGCTPVSHPNDIAGLTPSEFTLTNNVGLGPDVSDCIWPSGVAASGNVRADGSTCQ